MEKTVIINGKFMSESMSGIVRYAREIVNSLDSFIDNNMEIILLPQNAKNVSSYK